MSYSFLRTITLAAYAGLFASLFYWAFHFGPEQLAPMLALWLLMSIGLLLVAPGLLKGTRRSYIWLCFILLLYFLFYVQALFAGTVTAHEVISIVLVVTAFITSMLASRKAPA